MNPTQPPPELPFPSTPAFLCFFRPINRLKNLLKTLNKVHELLKQINSGISIEVNTNGIQFKIINGDQLLVLFTLLPHSDIASFEFNDTVTYQIDYSDLIGLIENQKGNADHILLYKIPGKPFLRCRYLNEKKKLIPHNILALSQLNVPIEFNRQGLKLVCTVAISCNLWRNGALKFLGKRNQTDIFEEVIFVITPNMVKIYTEKYEDNESYTYQQIQGNCEIKLEDETNEHEYRVYVQFMGEKPVIRASELSDVGVLRLYYGNKSWMTLSFESGGNGGNVMFVYYPRVFIDFNR